MENWSAFTPYSTELVQEHKWVEEALRVSKQRFHVLVENSLTGVSIIQDDQIVYQTRKFNRNRRSTRPGPNVVGVKFRLMQSMDMKLSFYGSKTAHRYSFILLSA